MGHKQQIINKPSIKLLLSEPINYEPIYIYMTGYTIYASKYNLQSIYPPNDTNHINTGYGIHTAS